MRWALAMSASLRHKSSCPVRDNQPRTRAAHILFPLAATEPWTPRNITVVFGDHRATVYFQVMRVNR